MRTPETPDPRTRGQVEPPIIPANPEAENGLLSSLLQTPDLFGQLPSDFGPPYFWCPSCQLVFTRARESWLSKRTLDFRSLEMALRTSGELELAGGPEAIDVLFAFVPSSANFSYYLQLVSLAYRRRETYLAATKLAYQAQNGDCPTLEALDGCLGQFGNATSFGSCMSDKTRDWHTQVLDWVEYASTAAQRRSANVVRFGIPELDTQVLPVEPGDFVVISGTRSSGKTALAGQLVDQVASKGGRVAWFSLEMCETQIIGRQISHRSLVPLQNIRSGLLTRDQLERLQANLESLERLPITLVDRRCSISDIVGELRRLSLGSQKPLEVAIVDYVQLINPLGLPEKFNKEQEIAYLSSCLKGIAKELKLVMVALSQVNNMGVTRDSSAIEQDADLILQVKEVLDKDKEPVADQRRILIKKQRNGIRGLNIRCQFQGEYLRFDAIKSESQNNNCRNPHNSD